MNMKKKTEYNREYKKIEKNLMGGRKKPCKRGGGRWKKEETDQKKEEKWKEMRRSKRKRDE